MINPRTFLNALEKRIPPKKDTHHSLTAGRYGSESTGWKEDLLVLRIATLNYFLDDDDLEKSEGELIDEICMMCLEKSNVNI